MSHHDHHGEGEAHHEEHLEVFEDSGITETSKPIFKWLHVVYVAFLIYFHWFVGSVFWFQQPNQPKWGAGWQVETKDDHGQWERNDSWAWGGTPHGLATVLLNGEDAADDAVKNREASVYHNPYGARR